MPQRIRNQSIAQVGSPPRVKPTDARIRHRDRSSHRAVVIGAHIAAPHTRRRICCPCHSVVDDVGGAANALISYFDVTAVQVGDDEIRRLVAPSSRGATKLARRACRAGDRPDIGGGVGRVLNRDERVMGLSDASST